MGERGPRPHPPLPQAEYEAVYARVPRLTVEVVAASDRGVLLARRTHAPCRGLWNLPGGTVRFGEPLTDAVARVARDEVGIGVVVDRLLGYIEYPSHLEHARDWPVGIAFAVRLAPGTALRTRAGALEWFTALPEDMHDEQRAFLRAHRLAR